jgi:AcrR family transcriptional regulator
MADSKTSAMPASAMPASAKPTRTKRRAERRDDALSNERIVDAAIALLDDEGEDGLTFRALAARLSTGSGAIYWHVANKGQLLAAATDAIVASALGKVPVSATPQEAILEIAAGVFEAIDEHPWVGAQLSHAPWRAATLQIFERIGQQVQAMGARGGAQFTAASALLSYIIGVSVQNAAQARALEAPVNRARFLAKEAARWQAFDAREFPFMRKVATRLAKHDDRAEFLGGIGFILAGVAAAV